MLFVVQWPIGVHQLSSGMARSYPGPNELVCTKKLLNKRSVTRA